MQKFGVIVQASLQSKRLPGKVLLELEPGVTMLGLLLKRVQQAGYPVAVSMPTERADDLLEAYCRQEAPSVRSIRKVRKWATMAWGPLSEVWKEWEWVVRLTADCPLAPVQEYAHINFYARMIAEAERLGVALLCTRSDRLVENYLPPGLDVEFFKTSLLRQAEGNLDQCWRLAQPMLQAQLHEPWEPGFSCTVDYWHDFEWVRRVYQELGGDISTERLRVWWNRYRKEQG